MATRNLLLGLLALLLVGCGKVASNAEKAPWPNPLAVGGAGGAEECRVVVVRNAALLLCRN